MCFCESQDTGEPLLCQIRRGMDFQSMKQSRSEIDALDENNRFTLASSLNTAIVAAYRDHGLEVHAT